MILINKRVAILGARGIGQLHARIFYELGVDIVAVLGSTEETAKKSADSINHKYAMSSRPFTNLSLLLDEVMRLDMVSICTPPEFHYEALTSVMDRGLPIFCEKPLFWSKNLTPLILKESLSFLENHPKRKIHVNTTNTLFLDHVLRFIDSDDPVTSFEFIFHTQGPFQREAISEDLLPHAVSLLIRLLGSNHKVSLLKKNIRKHFCRYNFYFGETEVMFEFQENPKKNKKLSFSINNREFTRFQTGQGSTYQVAMIDELTGEQLPTPDPFYYGIDKFVTQSKDIHSFVDEFEVAGTNLRIMSDILWGKNI